MKVWLLLLLPLVYSASLDAGNLTISNLTLFPSVKDSFNSTLSFSFTPFYPIPQQSVIQVNSTLQFGNLDMRDDCFLAGVNGVYVTSCNSSGTVLRAMLDSQNITEITSTDTLRLTVLRAFNLRTELKEVNITVETIWYATVINRNANLTPIAIQTVTQNFENLSIGMQKMMSNAMTNLTVGFSLPFTINMDYWLVLRFPIDFDPHIGMVRSIDQHLPCTSVPSLSPVCIVSYSTLEVKIGSSLAANTPVELKVTDVRMPPVFSEIQLLLLSSNLNVSAHSSTTPVATATVLDIQCCVTYRTVDIDCSDDNLIRACFGFGFNQAEFDGDMNTIRVRFKQAVDIVALRNAGQSCSSVLEVHTMRKLGNDPVCRWVDYYELTIFLGAYPTISKKDKLYFRLNKVRYNNTDRFISPPQMRILNPVSLPTPVAVLTKAGSISGCSVVQLDCLQSTGSGRRNLMCIWTLDKYEIAKGPIVVIGKSYVPAEKSKGNANFTVGLMVLNEWGLSNYVESTVFYEENSDIKVTFPFGSHTRFYYSKDFVFTLMVEISPSCSITSKDVHQYIWQSTAPNFPLCTGKNCRISARSIPVGTYSLTVSAQTETSSLFGNVTITFEVAPTPILIKTYGGNRLVRVNESVEIHGEMTTDPDRTGDQRVMLQWLVKDDNDQQVYPPVTSTVSDYVFNIPKGILHKNNTIYSVEVSTTSLSGGRERVTTKLWLETSNAPIYTIYTLPPPTVNPFDIVKISAISYAPTGSECAWTQVTHHNFAMLSAPSHPIFVFKPESFDVGLTYRFQYECITLKGNDTLISKAEVTIYINMPPVGGVFNIEPRRGVELETNFHLTAQNWMDRDGDYPLYYQYYYLEGETYRPFSPAMQQNNFTTVLARTSNSDAPITIVLYTCDALNACTRATQTVTLTPSSRNSTGLIERTLDQTLQIGNNSGDPREILTQLGQISVFLHQSLANGNITAEKAAIYNAELIKSLKSAVVQMSTNHTGPLSTEDQEIIMGSIIVSMVPNATTVAVAVQSLNIITQTMNISSTRYTTAPLILGAVDKVQQVIAAVPVTKENIDEIVSATAMVYEATDKLSQQVVERLTPGQFATNISLAGVIIYAERVRGRSNGTDMFVQDLSFEIHTGQLNGFYNVSISYDLNMSDSVVKEKVMEMIIRALLIPPQEVLYRNLPHQLCELIYENSPDYQLIETNGTCLNYTVTAAAEITTIYPRTQLIVQPYDTTTGNLNATAPSVQVNSGQSITHVLPIANYTGQVTCTSHNSQGLLDDSVCSKGETTPTSVVCACQSATDAFLSPDMSMEKALGNLVVRDTDDSPDIGEVTAGLLFLIWIVLVFLILFLFFVAVDQQEKEQKATIIARFGEFVQEVVGHLAVFDRPVYWQQRKRSSPVAFTLQMLFSQSLDEKSNRKMLCSAVCNAIKTLTTQYQLQPNGRPLLSIWLEYGALDTFKSRLSNVYFLKHIQALYFQYRIGIRGPVVGSALRRMNGEGLNCLTVLMTDDLMHYKTGLTEFIANNELLGLFLNRKVYITRAMRFPILLITFLGSLYIYSSNYSAYNSPNRQKLLQVGSLLSESMGLLWKIQNWYITFVILAISIVISFTTEKLLIWGKVDLPDMREIMQRYMDRERVERRRLCYCRVAACGTVLACLHRVPCCSKVLNCLGCVLRVALCLLIYAGKALKFTFCLVKICGKYALFRVLPVLICVALYILSFLSIWKLDKYDTFRVIDTTFKGFLMAGVGVGFFGVGALFTLPYWMKSLIRHVTGNHNHEISMACLDCCSVGLKFVIRVMGLVIEPVMMPFYAIRP